MSYGRRPVKTAAVGRSLRRLLRPDAEAVAAGADALMIHHPLDPFAAPTSQGDYFLEIAEASTVPVVAYLRSDAIPVVDLVRIANHPNVAGIKFRSTELMLLAECIRETIDSPAVWVCGLAEGWAPAFTQWEHGVSRPAWSMLFLSALAIWQALESDRYAEARSAHCSNRPVRSPCGPSTTTAPM